jgi:hypothetical protein
LYQKIKENWFIAALGAVLVVVNFGNLFFAKKGEVVTRQEATIMKQKIDDLTVSIGILKYEIRRMNDE